MPNLADIYTFMDEGGNSRGASIDPYNTDGGDSGYRTMMSYGGEDLGDLNRSTQGKDGWGGTDEEWLKKNGIKYSWDDDWRAGEAGQGAGGKKMLNVDWGSMPKTKFGNVNMTAPLNYRDGQEIKGRKPIDPKMVYNDQNYGKITHAMNIHDKQNPFFQYAGPGIMALAGMGMGSIAGAAGMGSSWNLANTAVQTARSIGNGGDWRNAALNAGLGAAGSYLGGLSPEVGNAIKYGKQAYGLYNMGRGLMGSRGGKG